MNERGDSLLLGGMTGVIPMKKKKNDRGHSSFLGKHGKTRESGGLVGAIWGLVGAISGLVGTIWGLVGAISGLVGTILKPFCKDFGTRALQRAPERTRAPQSAPTDPLVQYSF